MYDFSGIWYRIFNTGGCVLILGILCLLLSKFWNKKKFNKRGFIIAIVLFAFAIGYSLFMGIQIANPDIDSYDGYFVEERNDSRVSPPLPLTNAYVFTDNSGSDKPIFHLDIISKKKIYNAEFDTEKRYRIYYESTTGVIVKVEELQ